MTPPPPPAVPTAAALPSTLHSVERLAAFSDTLADFLDQWNSILDDANAIAASLPPLPDSGELAAPKPDPVAEQQLLAKWNSVLVASSPSSAAAGTVPVADRVAESSTKPSLVATVPVDAASAPAPASASAGTFPVADRVAESCTKPSPVAASAATGFPVAYPVPESDPKPSVLAVSNPSRAPEPVPTAPQPEPEPQPNSAPDRECRAGEPSAGELEKICKDMASRALRRFVTTHLGDRSWLRRVGPGALQRAPDPAALVLYAVSRYYICSESESAEVACVLLLELYVRAGCPRWLGQGEADLRVEAREAVLSWRGRIVQEKGRVADASVRDARGLIFLMAAFGVPAELPVQELYELLFAGGGFACIDVLKCSQLFVKKLRDVVADMLNKGSYHEAISVILAFELQSAFPLSSILTYIVEKAVHNRKDQESEGQCNLAGLAEFDKEELVLLRSILKYVEEHTSCPSEISSSSSVAERIKLLEERVGQPKQAFEAANQKRRTEDSLE